MDNDKDYLAEDDLTKDDLILANVEIGVTAPVNLAYYLYQVKDNLFGAAQVLQAYRRGIDEVFSFRAIQGFFYQVMTPEKENLFQEAISNPKSLFRLPLSSHVSVDGYTRLDNEFYSKSLKNKKNSIRVLHPTKQDAILCKILGDYRLQRPGRCMSTFHRTHFSRQIFDRLMTHARRGEYSPFMIAEWVDVILKYATTEYREDFCFSLVQSFWRFIERLYGDWSEVAEKCVNEIWGASEIVLFEEHDL